MSVVFVGRTVLARNHGGWEQQTRDELFFLVRIALVERRGDDVSPPVYFISFDR